MTTPYLRVFYTILGAGLMGATLLIAQARAEAGDIVFARAEDADSLDTARVSSTISLQVMTQIYEPLLTLDADGKFHGGLAQS